MQQTFDHKPGCGRPMEILGSSIEHGKPVWSLRCSTCGASIIVDMNNKAAERERRDAYLRAHGGN